MPVTSAPTSTNACTGGFAVATDRNSARTSQSAPISRADTTDSSARVASTLASVPGSNFGAPSSSGSKSAGVPLNPSRRGKSKSPPSSCPVALSFMPWCLAVLGKTYPSR